LLRKSTRFHDKKHYSQKSTDYKYVKDLSAYNKIGVVSRRVFRKLYILVSDQMDHRTHVHTHKQLFFYALKSFKVT